MGAGEFSAARPPMPVNEPVRDYAPGSPERERLLATLKAMESERHEAPLVIGGREVRTGDLYEQVLPHRKSHVLADVHQVRPEDVDAAIAAAKDAQAEWASTPWQDRAAVFSRAADLLAGPWRDRINAATMLGQSKTVHQAEIDAACELVDFWRFNVAYMHQIYSDQPMSSAGMWNRMDYRPLEGFVLAISPFNFTSIAGNLTGSCALMGNVVVWKPALTATYSGQLLLELLTEAGLPPGVINLLHGDGAVVGDTVFKHPDFGGLHFTGSTAVFKHLWSEISANLDTFRNYPRVVGETGGKDFIVAHPSADAAAAGHRGDSRRLRVPGPEVLGGLARLRAIEHVGRGIRAARRRDQDHTDGRRLRPHELHGRRHRRQGDRQTQERDRLREALAECGHHRGRRDRRFRGLLRRADDHPYDGSAVAPSERGVLRTDRHRLRLRGLGVRPRCSSSSTRPVPTP